MCGICGVINKERDDDYLVRGMCSRMVHRGPDDDGFFSDDVVSFGMRRLKIIDLEGGHQPISTPDKRYWIVCNGEIYNYRELGSELATAGLLPRSKSDVEIALLAYVRWGDAFLQRLHGMFALCVWDTERQRAIVARDRMGKKPLYYRTVGNRIVFASELKCLLADRAQSRSLNVGACHSYLDLGYVAGSQSILEGARRLRPGGMLVIERGRAPTEHAYWSQPQPDPAAGRARWHSEEHAAGEIGDLLADATRLRLVADVPVGAFLSGGLDSSLVVSMMRYGGHAALKTFSVGFPGNGGMDESAFSSIVASELRTDHHPLPLGDSAASALPEVAWQLDEPLGDQAAVPTYHLSKLAAADVKVVLTGEGADELFGGYERYALFQALSRAEDVLGRPAFGALSRFLPENLGGSHFLNRVSRAARGGFADFDRAYRSFVGPFNALAHAPYRGPALLDSPTQSRAQNPAPDSRVARMQLADMQGWLPDDLLVKVDRMSMAASLEARCPYLDHRLVELCALLPDEWKVRGRKTKVLLRRIGSRFLPETILRRRKHIFAVPIAGWLRGPLAALATDALQPSSVRRLGVFEESVGSKLLARHMSGEDHSRAIWPILMFQLWAQGLAKAP